MIDKLIDIAFSGFWSFIGVFLLTCVIGEVIIQVFQAIFNGSWLKANVLEDEVIREIRRRDEQEKQKKEKEAKAKQS